MLLYMNWIDLMKKIKVPIIMQYYNDLLLDKLLLWWLLF